MYICRYSYILADLIQLKKKPFLKINHFKFDETNFLWFHTLLLIVLF